jgi:hypothetical protein
MYIMYLVSFNTFVQIRCTFACVYYGLTINIGKFGGNLHSNYALSITAELLGYSMCFLLDKTGRKPMHLGVLFGSSVACFLSLIPILLLDECKYTCICICNNMTESIKTLVQNAFKIHYLEASILFVDVSNS